MNFLKHEFFYNKLNKQLIKFISREPATVVIQVLSRLHDLFKIISNNGEEFVIPISRKKQHMKLLQNWKKWKINLRYCINYLLLTINHSLGSHPTLNQSVLLSILCLYCKKQCKKALTNARRSS